MSNEQSANEQLERNKKIEELMRETYLKAKELQCEIKVNPKKKTMSWSKF